MIYYQNGKWNLALICAIKGSVFPRAVVWALSASSIGAVLAIAFRDIENDDIWKMTDDQLKNVMGLWSGFNFILGFLLVFRTQQAYSRFWEGSTLLQAVRGEWFNATSSLFAFCTNKPERQQEVVKFQHVLVRLMSMLYCTALQQVYRDSNGEPVRFEILDPAGMDEGSLEYLDEKSEQTEILVQWIQRLIVNHMETGILPIPPPVITRAFQELSRGVVHLHDARKIAEIPFPFPYAQMLTVLLLVHWILTPVFSSVMIPQASWVFFMTFILVLAFWSMQYIAAEIEFPFGNDENDLPISMMMGDMNTSLLTLLHELSQKPPDFVGPTDQNIPIKILDSLTGEKTTFHGRVKSARWTYSTSRSGTSQSIANGSHAVGKNLTASSSKSRMSKASKVTSRAGTVSVKTNSAKSTNFDDDPEFKCDDSPQRIGRTGTAMAKLSTTPERSEQPDALETALLAERPRNESSSSESPPRSSTERVSIDRGRGHHSHLDAVDHMDSLSTPVLTECTASVSLQLDAYQAANLLHPQRDATSDECARRGTGKSAIHKRSPRGGTSPRLPPLTSIPSAVDAKSPPPAMGQTGSLCESNNSDVPPTGASGTTKKHTKVMSRKTGSRKPLPSNNHNSIIKDLDAEDLFQ